eukprot:10429887-Alexandrium_andersonii.AAC.1
MPKLKALRADFHQTLNATICAALSAPGSARRVWLNFRMSRCPARSHPSKPQSCSRAPPCQRPAAFDDTAAKRALQMAKACGG